MLDVIKDYCNKIKDKIINLPTQYIGIILLIILILLLLK